MKIVKFQHESASAQFQYVDKDVVFLNNLWSEERGQGHASELMNKIVTYADQNQLTIIIIAQRYGNPNRSALNNRQLEEFYVKFGFDYDGVQSRPSSMKRYPSQKKHAS